MIKEIIAEQNKKSDRTGTGTFASFVKIKKTIRDFVYEIFKKKLINFKNKKGENDEIWP